MKLFRAVLVGAASLGCALSISMLIWLFALQATVLNRETVKTWVHESGAYSKVINELIKADPRTQTTTSALVTPEVVRTALTNTFTPDYVQTQSKRVIDNAFDWVDGSKPRIEFSIPIDDKKTTLVDQLSLSLEPKIAAMPTCSALSQLNLTQPSCRPPQLTTAELARRVAMQTVEQSALAQAPLTEQTLSQQQPGTAQQDVALLSQLPSYRQWLHILLIALPIFAVACIVLIVVLAVDRLRSFAHLARRIFVGSLLTLGLALGMVYLGSNPAMIPGFDNAHSAATIFLPVLQRAFASIGQLVAWTSGGVTVVSGTIGLTLWLIQHRRQPQAPISSQVQSSHTPQTPESPSIHKSKVAHHKPDDTKQP